MPFSEFLSSKREDCKKLIRLLSEKYNYASLLGSDNITTRYRADKESSSVSEDEYERGFVIKINDGEDFFEYSFNEFPSDIDRFINEIEISLKRSKKIGGKRISPKMSEQKCLKKDFIRSSDFEEYTDEQLLTFCKEISGQISNADEHVVQGMCMLRLRSVSQLFVNGKKDLTQHYCWANGYAIAVYKGEKMVQAREEINSHMVSDIIEKLPSTIPVLINKSEHISRSKPIEPGYYDVITDSTISGLIAHEAFGHGVEMDQFVKDRALAKQYMNKRVASDVVNMRDGAASTISAASYFFDDDGVLASDTQIIKNGILVAGLSDLATASQLGTKPSGNGRRDNYKRKAYTRMTNTFFEKGTSKIEDMISSIKHGYMIFETNNGMEDPKNWQIQCVAEYGIEIVDGKLTENYVSPVVISGYVPDLLKSISMVSDECVVHGSGMCGKGYKEWVYVSDGGPALKAKVKLG